MSPRAAWRLESLGFGSVFEYAGGKLDWLAAGMPTEGTATAHPRAADVARRDVPTCGMEERLGDVRQRVRQAGWDLCVVVNGHGVVLGLLRKSEVEAGDDRRVEDVMLPGPSTFRPHVPVVEMARFMGRHDLAAAPITTSDGRLVGILRREDAEAEAHRLHVGPGREEGR